MAFEVEGKWRNLCQKLFFSRVPVKHYPRKHCNTNAKERGWTTTTIIVGWIFIYLYASGKTIAQHLFPSLAPFATSHFSGLSLLSSQAVVESAIFVVARPACAKISDHMGRLEAWVVVVVAHIIGAVLYAASPNIGCYFAGTVFWEIGMVGGHLMMELYAADTSTTETRVLASYFIQSPSVWAPWISAPVVAGFLKVTTWRWGYGSMAIIIPGTSIGILITLFYMRVKYENKLGGQGDFYSPGGPMRFIKSFDIIGLLAVGGAMILFFLPITFAAGTDKWKYHSYIAMLTIGSFLMVFTPIWEVYGTKTPLIPWRLFKSRIMCISSAQMFLLSMANKIYIPYFVTWLLVVKGQSPKAATNVSSTLIVTANAWGLFAVAPYMWWRGHCKRVIVIGTCLHLVGIGMTYHYRTPHGSLAVMIIAQVFEGVGRGMIYIPAVAMAQAVFDKHKVASVTALYYTTGGVGQVIGDSISGAIYRTLYPKYIHKYAPDIPKKDLNMIINKIKKATKYPMGSKVRTEINMAFNEAMRHMLLGPFGCVAGMIVLSLFYPMVNLKEASDDVYDAPDFTSEEEDVFTPHPAPGTEGDLEKQHSGDENEKYESTSENGEHHSQEGNLPRVSAEAAAAGYVNNTQVL
ncbi:Siderophore iron transporter mirC [Yarrowia sp. B02]|nr:Siderophore iron transporter mirC [Yarrowia sp. B02]